MQIKSKIAVDAGCLGVSDKRLKVGVYQMARNLLLHLSSLDRQNNYYLYSFYPLDKELVYKFNKNFHNIVLRPKAGWFNFRLSIQMLLHKHDIFLGLSQFIPPIHPDKTIVFIHDLAFEYYPKLYAESYERLSKRTKKAVQRATKIIAVSQATKNDLDKFYNVNKNKMIICYEGVDKDLAKKVNKREEIKILNEYKIRKPYFLFVGALKKIKNVPYLIEEFMRFKKMSKTDTNLVIAGSDFWIDERINWSSIENTRRIDRGFSPHRESPSGHSRCVLPAYLHPGISNDNIKYLGFVSEKEKIALLKNAIAFILPSLYEGFGLTLLETMICGVPIICSDRGSIKEIGKDACLYINPEKTGSLSNALKKMISDKKLRDNLISKGKQRVKLYSWQKFAKCVLKEINEL